MLCDMRSCYYTWMRLLYTGMMVLLIDNLTWLEARNDNETLDINITARFFEKIMIKIYTVVTHGF